MTTQIESDLERVSQRPKIQKKDFINILATRIELIQFVSMKTTDGLLLTGKTLDEQGREKHIVRINSNNPKEEQARTLAHEITHIHYGLPTKWFGDSEYENFIEEEEDRFFDENKELVMRAFRIAQLADNVTKGHPFAVAA